MPDFRRNRPTRNAPLQSPRPRERPAGLGRGNGAAQDRMGQQTGQQQGGAVLTSPLPRRDPRTDETGRKDHIDEAMLEAAVTAAVATVPQTLRAGAETHIPVLLRECADSRVYNANQVAYILATAEHESRFGVGQFTWSEPLVEDHNQYSQRSNGTWRSRDHVKNRRVTGDTEAELDEAYWDSAYGGNLGNQRGTDDASNYRGRGYVQLTGRVNYERMSQELNDEGFQYTLDGVTWGTEEHPIDLLANPTHVNRCHELAARITVDGMMDGDFTGAALPDYVNDDQASYRSARSVVNGDGAEVGEDIASYARRYSGAITSVWSQVFVMNEIQDPRTPSPHPDDRG
ncbi:MAG: hypothetical protein H6742_17550 [Alphaproteobacteria bacterium]|nr:hypothetical protein [Alphaproteobacteria bacterium]